MQKHWGRKTLLSLLSGTFLLVSLACEPLQKPPSYEVIELSGSPYERGFQHGQAFSSKIRSMYTQMLETSLLPYLNRERPDLSSLLWQYRDPVYDGGVFSYMLLLESGYNLELSIPADIVEEMHGIAEGAGIEYKKILILNTFMDSMLGVRAIAFFIRALQAPQLVSLSFAEQLDSDGIDNDGDGVIDEPDEHLLSPFKPSPYASAVEIPVDSEIVLRLRDDDGVDPKSIRVMLDTQVYTIADPEMTYEEIDAGRILQVHFKPSQPLQSARVYSLQISAADKTWVTEPPPAHARTMRDLRISFGTLGLGESVANVGNRGFYTGIYQPPSIIFAARGSATADGQPFMAQHFALLDSNTAHKHTVLFVHHPTNGHSFAILGWTGVVAGFSCMNDAGLCFAANSSDSLDNPLVDAFRQDTVSAKLLSSGVPIGMMGRELLEQSENVVEAETQLRSMAPTFGWNMMLADASGGLRAIEMDSNILQDSAGSFFAYDPDPTNPENLNAQGQPYASVGPDDLRMASHFQKNAEDIDLDMMGYRIGPQRSWSSFYFRSLRSFYALGDEIEAKLGLLNVDEAKGIMRKNILQDPRDSMNAVIFEPSARRLNFSMGQMPATEGPYHVFSFADTGEP